MTTADLAADRLAALARQEVATLVRRDTPAARMVRRRYSSLLKNQPARSVVDFAIALSADGLKTPRRRLA